MFSLKSSLVALAVLAPSLHAQEAAPTVKEAESLVKNGSVELDANSDQWPDNWPRHKDATWEKEGENHFIRLKSPAPGATVLLFQKAAIPAGTKVLELKWRQRASNLKPGVQAWFDARIMLEFRNAGDQKVAGAPGAPYVRKDTDGWVEKAMTINVPDGATHFAFMPSLFQVETGTFDLDDFKLTAVQAAPK